MCSGTNFFRCQPASYCRAFALTSFFAILVAGRIGAQSTTPIFNAAAQASGQDTVQAALSPLDSSVYAPESTAKLGQRDAAAASEFAAYNSLLGDGGNWPGMQGVGTVTYSTDPAQYDVTITNQGSDRFRLDVQTPSGIESTRIQRRVGKIQSANTAALAIDPETAILGIFPFQITGRVASSGQNATFLDRGIAAKGGRSLHRVTLEVPSLMKDPSTKAQRTLPVDLYFDPATHLLVKSVCYILIPGSRQVPFLSVVTYSDHRVVGTSLIPFHYSETLNGQPYRTVQLNSVQLNPTLPTTYFQFERSNR